MPEEPIVIGGGSVTIDFSDTFANEPAPLGQRKYKKEGQLRRVEVNGKTVADLDATDEVSVIYET